MINFKRVSCRYAGSNARALDDITIDFADGSFTAIMGANGSGKSTLARCMNGLVLPEAGVVLVDGVSTLLPDSLLTIRRNVGLVFQDPDSQMTSGSVERELAFALQNVGIPNDKVRELVAIELRRLNMAERREVPPAMLSGGEKVRLALAAVLMLEPKHLVLDEPTSFLSRASRRHLVEDLLALRESKQATVIFITQFLDEAAKADRLLVLDKSKIVFDGPPIDILRDTNQPAAWGISIPANIHSLP